MTEITTVKPKTTFTTEQRLDYAKLMVNEGYTNKQVMVSRVNYFVRFGDNYDGRLSD